MPGKNDDENALYGDALLDETGEQDEALGQGRIMSFLESLSPEVVRLQSVIAEKIDAQFQNAWSPSWDESNPIAFATALYIPPEGVDLPVKKILAGQFIKAENQLQDEIGRQLGLLNGGLRTMLGLLLGILACKKEFDPEFINYALYIISVALMSIIPKRIASCLFRSIQELRLSGSTDPEALLGFFQKKRFEALLEENGFADKDTTPVSNRKSTRPHPFLDA